MDVSDEHWDKVTQIGQQRLKLLISWSTDHRVVEGAETGCVFGMLGGLC
jgi:hypothetical protein